MSTSCRVGSLARRLADLPTTIVARAHVRLVVVGHFMTFRRASPSSSASCRVDGRCRRVFSLTPPYGPTHNGESGWRASGFLLPSCCGGRLARSRCLLTGFSARRIETRRRARSTRPSAARVGRPADVESRHQRAPSTRRGRRLVVAGSGVTPRRAAQSACYDYCCRGRRHLASFDGHLPLRHAVVRHADCRRSLRRLSRVSGCDARRDVSLSGDEQ